MELLRGNKLHALFTHQYTWSSLLTSHINKTCVLFGTLERDVEPTQRFPQTLHCSDP
jgi:hypothetical protein